MTNTENEYRRSQEPSDEELIARFQNEDMYAFDMLVKRYKEPLLSFVYRFITDREESEDIVQETFYRLFKNKHYYKEVARFSTWIYTIASNLAKTELRKRRRRNLFSIHQTQNTDDKDFEIPDTTNDPERDTNTKITDKIIQNAINKLSPKFREVIILRDVQEFSYEEISDIVGIPLGTVKSRVNRARLRLQEDLKHLI